MPNEANPSIITRPNKTLTGELKNSFYPDGDSMDNTVSGNEPMSESKNNERITEIRNYMGKFFEPFEKNLSRVFGFLSAYKKIVEINRSNEIQGLTGLASLNLSEGIFEGYDSTDLLRSAVVFLHACLEEMLRAIALEFLPSASKDCLDKIPLATKEHKPRAEKFSLGSLKEFCGKTVEEVIRDSIDKHLKHSTYGNIREIKELLKNTGFNEDMVGPFSSSIAALMERRHTIVHRADVLATCQRYTPQPIESLQVVDWANAVLEFEKNFFTP